MSVRKIRIFPNSAQKELFSKCFKTHVNFYNKVINRINKKFKKRNQELSKNKTCLFCNCKKVKEKFACEEHIKNKIPWNIKVNFIDLRRKILGRGDTSKYSAKYSDVPYDTCQLAIKSAVSMYRSCLTNLSRGNINHFNMKPLEEKTRSVFFADGNALKVKNGELSIFVNRLKKNSYLRIKPRAKSKLIREKFCKVLHDFIVSRDLSNRYYLMIPVNVTKSTEQQKKHIISIDPGSRTPFTGYSPTMNSVLKFGEFCVSKIKTLFKKQDLFRSLKDTKSLKHHKCKSINRRIRKLYSKIKDVVSNFHNQTASLLARKFQLILLPKFETSRMVSKKGNLVSASRRILLTLSHFKFQEKLKQLTSKYGSKLVIVTEEFTTKTCGACGKINDNVGKSEVFACCDKNCEYTLDRDAHGARNILIKYMSKLLNKNG